MDENEDVLVKIDGSVGRITLNRPKAINSLTHPMVTRIGAALTAWQDDDAVACVIVAPAVPLGIALPVGLRISVDGAPGQNLGFQTCDQAGCYVGEPFPDDLLSAMKAGNVVSISFEDNQKRPIKLDFSLKGFTKALTDISPA